MKATGIVRRVDDLGRIVIPKEIRRTLRIREGDPLQITLTSFDLFCSGIHSFVQRITAEWHSLRCRYLQNFLGNHAADASDICTGNKFKSDSAHAGEPQI